MNSADLGCRHALLDQVAAGRLAIRYYGVRESVCHAFGEALGSAAPGGLPARRDANGHASKRCRRNAEDVGVEIMSVQNVNVVLAQLSRKAAKLNDEIAIMEARERIGRDFDLQAVDLLTQDAGWIQAGDVHLVVSSFLEQAGKLDGLKLRAALMKAADEL